MPSIDEQEFIALEGEIQAFAEEVEAITRPGIDGTALRQLAQRAQPFELISTVDVDDLTALEAAYTAYLALQGTVVDITDQHGTEHANFVVLRVVRERAFKVAAASGGLSTSKGYILICRWTMQAAGVPGA